ncbi:Hpt domain-containing protein [uncultured Parvibaculum sp.]|uniref:Hpt domain-containing protein n=1 Tax=uncultured Parvibaculum sp. TaxID=291828 RepID=UPI0030DC89F3|tara:strand:- start:15796 stop:16230 length:435 start_codon:yes stop_codon:yes gene_type:complete
MAIPKDEATGDYGSLIAQAEAAVEALRDTYRVQLAEDIAALEEVWARVEGGAPADEALAEMHSIAHNIKGQGGSFGYDLVTVIGASFCDYLRSGTRVSPEERNIVNMHIRMLKTVSDNNIAGDGGETGQRIAEKLRALTGRGEI